MKSPVKIADQSTNSSDNDILHTSHDQDNREAGITNFTLSHPWSHKDHVNSVPGLLFGPVSSNKQEEVSEGLESTVTTQNEPTSEPFQNSSLNEVSKLAI